jgi:hypothetical protein
MAEDEETKAQDFSYEGDIQPLMNQYFSVAANSGLSGDAQISFLRGQRSRLEGQADKAMDLKLRSIAFEDAKLRLEENRKKSLGARENMTALSALQQQLEFGLTEVPEEQRPTYFAKVGIANSALIASDETAKTMVSSALRAETPSKSNTGMELQNSILKGLDSVKFGEDYSGKPTNSFANAGEKAAVDRVIASLGTPEEIQQSAEMSADELYGLAKNIRTRYDASILGGGKAATTSSPRSLFSSKTVAPMATPP